MHRALLIIKRLLIINLTDFELIVHVESINISTRFLTNFISEYKRNNTTLQSYGVELIAENKSVNWREFFILILLWKFLKRMFLS